MTQTRKRATSNKRFGHKKNSGNLRLSVKKIPIQKKKSKKQYSNRQVGGDTTTFHAERLSGDFTLKWDERWFNLIQDGKKFSLERTGVNRYIHNTGLAEPPVYDNVESNQHTPTIHEIKIFDLDDSNDKLKQYLKTDRTAKNFYTENTMIQEKIDPDKKKKLVSIKYRYSGNFRTKFLVMDTGNYKIFTDFFRTKNNSKIYFQDTTKDEEEKRQAAEEEKRQAAEEEKRQAKAAALATRQAVEEEAAARQAALVARQAAEKQALAEEEALAEKARQEAAAEKAADDNRTVTDIDDTELQKILEVLSQKYEIPQDKEIFEETETAQNNNTPESLIKEMFKRAINILVYFQIKLNTFQNNPIIRKLQNICQNQEFNDENVRLDSDHWTNTQGAIKLIMKKLKLENEESIDDFKQKINTYLKKLMECSPESIESLGEVLIEKSLLSEVSPMKWSEVIKKTYKFLDDKFYKEIVAHLQDSAVSLIYKYLKILSTLCEAINVQITEVVKQNENLSKLSSNDNQDLERNLFRPYFTSNVITYVKIRDNESSFNPRYLYMVPKKNVLENYTDLEKKDLTLLYTNDPFIRLEMSPQGPEMSPQGPEMSPQDVTTINLKDSNQLYMDHAFNFGPFDKIFYGNISNADIGKKMMEVQKKLLSGENVFIIGYGASGSGKTTTLIQNNVDKEKPKDGAIIEMLNKLAQEQQKFRSGTLTIHEIFPCEPQESKNEQFIESFEKVTDIPFSFKDRDKFVINQPIVSSSDQYSDLCSFFSEEESLSKVLSELITVKRKVAATTNNPESSRSHVIVTFIFNNQNGTQTKLYVGDLAGVENKFDFVCDEKTYQQIGGAISKLESEDSSGVKETNEILKSIECIPACFRKMSQIMVDGEYAYKNSEKIDLESFKRKLSFLEQKHVDEKKSYSNLDDEALITFLNPESDDYSTIKGGLKLKFFENFFKTKPTPTKMSKKLVGMLVLDTFEDYKEDTIIGSFYRNIDKTYLISLLQTYAVNLGNKPQKQKFFVRLLPYILFFVEIKKINNRTDLFREIYDDPDGEKNIKTDVRVTNTALSQLLEETEFNDLIPNQSSTTIDVNTEFSRIQRFLGKLLESPQPKPFKFIKDPGEIEKKFLSMRFKKILLKRVFQMHYETVNRSYEGWFINKSLEAMRKQITKNIRENNQGDLSPNFNIDCMSYHGNNLLPTFSSNSSEEIEREYNKINEVISPPGSQLKLSYCIFLVINNSYHDQDKIIINNPPPIPYINLRDAYKELERYQLLNPLGDGDLLPRILKGKIDTNIDKDMLSIGVKELISGIFGFTKYNNFAQIKLGINDTFKPLHTYTIQCYEKAHFSEQIIKGLKEKYDDIVKGNEVENTPAQSQLLIKTIKEYLSIIDNLNATTIVGTLDFTDELSKYNLKYQHCVEDTKCSLGKESDFLNTNLSFLDKNYKLLQSVNHLPFPHKLLNLIQGEKQKENIRKALSENKCQSAGKKVYRNMTKKGSQKKNRMRLLKRKTDSKYSHKLISSPHKRTHYRGNRATVSRKK